MDTLTRQIDMAEKKVQAVNDDATRTALSAVLLVLRETQAKFHADEQNRLAVPGRE